MVRLIKQWQIVTLTNIIGSNNNKYLYTMITITKYKLLNEQLMFVVLTIYILVSTNKFLLIKNEQ